MAIMSHSQQQLGFRARLSQPNYTEERAGAEELLKDTNTGAKSEHVGDFVNVQTPSVRDRLHQDPYACVADNQTPDPNARGVSDGADQSEMLHL